VAALFVVAAGLVETGILAAVTRRLLGHVEKAPAVLRRVVPASVAASAFLNNTTIVAPVAVSAAQQAGLDPRGFALTVAVGAFAGFLLPAGYQTHLMVFGPGGYRVRDFIRVGVPMVALWFVVTMLLVPWAWF